jgi:nitroimidazol reductase NimA-like FMN-containing flavoprotein (pyridoxamine 5'-phosphate oxidase superfamily)
VSRRDKIKMSPDEVRRFLAEEMKVQIATLNKNGEPHLVTMFYALEDGRLAFTTYATSQKVVNLRRDPTMTCLVEAGSAYNELRGVTLFGQGRIVTDQEVLMRVGTRIGAAMAGLPAPEPDAPLDPVFAAGMAQTMRKRVAVIMEPRRIASWDHRKLA